MVSRTRCGNPSISCRKLFGTASSLLVKRLTGRRKYHPLVSLKSSRCRLLGWGDWSKCNVTSTEKMNKTRSLVGFCSSRGYFDYAPCLCPWKNCPSTEVVENYTVPECSENSTEKSFYLQMLPFSRGNLYHSRKDLDLGGIGECLPLS
ncbi:hypothetical protein GCK32_004794 [Trichostrongylus colubriformis]|uniref:Uncharacterized protein n=1 Tax=Trichostrongylus colubriformis TaxID=6319 RepID=A0AAN8F1S7_TRICO